jgi:hypothetical protein
MTYKVNTSSISTMTASSALADIQSASILWTTQSQANWNFTYGGTTSVAGSANDGTNAIYFTNTTPTDGYLAATNCWASTTTLLDCDISVREATVAYYTTDEICDPAGSANGGIYLLDILAHEFGHSLGLLHSEIVDATMRPGVTPCDTRSRTLETDDITGIQSIYGNVPAPTPVPAPSPVPTPIPAPIPPPPESAYLSVRAYKVKGVRKVDLNWAGLTTVQADVYRGNARIIITDNDGFYTDPVNGKGGGTFTYKICERASVENCTNLATAAF